VKLSQKSLDRLTGVHPHLVEIVKRAVDLDAIDFAVLEGVRSTLRQAELVAAGASRTMKSRHLTGHAVDLGAFVAGTLRWDWPLYHKLNTVMQQAAKDQGTRIEWGGHWKSFPDGPHFQLPWETYPA
jgi:peptidoglycan L-alanyl-D-glutamate endopeptidase CwlK